MSTLKMHAALRSATNLASERSRSIIGLCERMGALIDAIDTLIRESDGVVGLLDGGGDTPWRDLLRGGCESEYLEELEVAREALVAEGKRELGRERRIYRKFITSFCSHGAVPHNPTDTE